MELTTKNIQNSSQEDLLLSIKSKEIAKINHFHMELIIYISFKKNFENIIDYLKENLDYRNFLKSSFTKMRALPNLINLNDEKIISKFLETFPNIDVNCELYQFKPIHIAISKNSLSIAKILFKKMEEQNNFKILFKKNFALTKCLIEMWPENIYKTIFTLLVDYLEKNNFDPKHPEKFEIDKNVISTIFNSYKEEDILNKSDNNNYEIIEFDSDTSPEIVSSFISETDHNSDSDTQEENFAKSNQINYFNNLENLPHKTPNAKNDINNTTPLNSDLSDNVESNNDMNLEKSFPIDLNNNNQIISPIQNTPQMTSGSRIQKSDENFQIQSNVNNLQTKYKLSIAESRLRNKGELERFLIKCLINGDLETALKIFFKNKIDLYYQYEGSTILHIACEKGYLEIVKEIAKRDKKIFALQNKNNLSPLLTAASFEKFEIVKFLSISFPLILLSENKFDLLKEKIFSLKNDNIKEFLTKFYFRTMSNIATILTNYLLKYNFDMALNYCILLQEKKFNLDYIDQTALIHLIFFSIEEKQPEVAAFFLRNANSAKINWNFQNAKGDSLLHIAAINDEIELVKLLIMKPEININIVNRKEFTPTFIAAKKGYLEILKILIQNGGHIGEKLSEEKNDFLKSKITNTDIREKLGFKEKQNPIRMFKISLEHMEGKVYSTNISEVKDDLNIISGNKRQKTDSQVITGKFQGTNNHDNLTIDHTNISQFTDIVEGEKNTIKETRYKN